jgi:hypothetical protein
LYATVGDEKTEGHPGSELANRKDRGGGVATFRNQATIARRSFDLARSSRLPG